MNDKNWRQWRKEYKYDVKWLVIGIFILLAIFFGESKANPYSFPMEDKITMDVTMVNGTSGTYLCPSARECYVKSLEYEARGGHQYCVSLVMKRNGKVIWWRKYR